METHNIKNRIQDQIITKQFPELLNVEPQVETGPAESRLRALRRSRAVVSEADVKTVPVEHKFIYHLKEDKENPFDRTIVVVTDEQGEIKFVVESK